MIFPCPYCRKRFWLRSLLLRHREGICPVRAQQICDAANEELRRSAIFRSAMERQQSSQLEMIERAAKAALANSKAESDQAAALRLMQQQNIDCRKREWEDEAARKRRDDDSSRDSGISIPIPFFDSSPSSDSSSSYDSGSSSSDSSSSSDTSGGGGEFGGGGASSEW